MLYNKLNMEKFISTSIFKNTSNYYKIHSKQKQKQLNILKTLKIH